MAENNLPSVEVPSVADVVYDILRKQILRGQFSPGEQLNLSAIEQQLNVSRTPLKMALSRLKNEGLVEIHSRRGTYVTQFTHKDIEECFELRIAIEAQAIRHAFDPHNDPLCREILRLFEKMQAFFQDESTWLDQLIQYMDLDRLVHIKLVTFSHNSRMQQAYEYANVQGYIAIMGANFLYEDVLKTQAEHQHMLAALRAKDQATLAAAARHHLESARDRALERLTALSQSEEQIS